MKSPPRPQDQTLAEATETRLRLYNTLTRRKEDFAPIDPKLGAALCLWPDGL